MNHTHILTLQKRLAKNEHENSFYKVSTRQLNIFKTVEDRKDYINYIVTYALKHSKLSFIKGIEYKNQKTFSYSLKRGIINIPIHTIHEKNFINYVPLIISLVEYHNVYYTQKKDINIFNQILYNNIKTLFKVEEPWLLNDNILNLNDVHVDYIEKNAMEFLIKSTKETPVKTMAPNINEIYQCKDLFMFKSNGIFVVKRSLNLEN